MQHGLGRVARGLILLGVVLGHGLLLALPGPSHRSLAAIPELQVALESAPQAPTVTAPQAEKTAPTVAPKPRVPALSPRIPPSMPVMSAPLPVQAKESAVIAEPVMPSGAATPSRANDAATTVVGTAKPASGMADAPVVRMAASCDTRLLDSDYPTAARRDELEGRVLVQAHVLPTGRVQEARVAKGSGFAVLDDAALRASSHWRCTPARRNGVAEDSRIAVPVVFRLND